mmetsp:Transcript_61679/g.139635  ORF Transcript_61679/g.139635 Transcript_61679/m.139635 type:complete len:240 (-) Transcript_61679:18-737(-)
MNGPQGTTTKVMMTTRTTKMMTTVKMTTALTTTKLSSKRQMATMVMGASRTMRTPATSKMLLENSKKAVCPTKPLAHAQKKVQIHTKQFQSNTRIRLLAVNYFWQSPLSLSLLLHSSLYKESAALRGNASRRRKPGSSMINLFNRLDFYQRRRHRRMTEETHFLFFIVFIYQRVFFKAVDFLQYTTPWSFKQPNTRTTKAHTRHNANESGHCQLQVGIIPVPDPPAHTSPCSTPLFASG